MDYRDDYDALRARADAMERELAELRAELDGLRRAPHGGLERELEVTRQQLADVRIELIYWKKRAGGEVLASAPARPAPPPPSRPAPDSLEAAIDLEAQDEHTQAVEAFTRLLDKNARNTRALAGLARAWLGLGDPDAAQTCYRRLLLLPDGSGLTRAEIYLALAGIHNERGEPAKALAMIERGLEIEPGHAGLRAEKARLGG